MSLELSLTHSGQLAILLPSGLRVTAPFNDKGLALLRELLEAQSNEDYQVIGTRSSPIQYVVDKYILNGGKVTVGTPRGPVRRRLEKVSDGIYKVRSRPKQDTISLADLLAEEG